MSVDSIARKAGFQVSARSALEQNPNIQMIERAVQRGIDSGLQKQKIAHTFMDTMVMYSVERQKLRALLSNHDILISKMSLQNEEQIEDLFLDANRFDNGYDWTYIGDNSDKYYVIYPKRMNLFDAIYKLMTTNNEMAEICCKALKYMDIGDE